MVGGLGQDVQLSRTFSSAGRVNDNTSVIGNELLAWVIVYIDKIRQVQYGTKYGRENDYG
jgi:hypothetical protein